MGDREREARLRNDVSGELLAIRAGTVGQYGARSFGPLALFVGSVWTAQALMVVLYMMPLFFVDHMSLLLQRLLLSFRSSEVEGRAT